MTPSVSGMPTHAQASARCQALVPSGFRSVILFPLLSSGRLGGANDHLRPLGFVIGLHVEATVDCLNQQVADKADHQESRHDVHSDVISLCRRHAVRNIILTNVVHQHRPEYAGHRPGSKQQSMDGTDIAGAEHVFQVGRYGGEAAAVHADDYEEAADESDHAADLARIRDGAVQQEAEHHEHEVRVLAADIVRCGGPEEATAHVE